MNPGEPNPKITELLDGDTTLEELPFYYIYRIAPVSERWDALKDLPAIQRFTQDHRSLNQDWEQARELLANHSSWDGDTANGPAPILVPNANTWQVLGWVVKQSQDGWTYVISRFPLPWLRADAEEVIELEYDEPPRIQA